jgi:serine/threonine protein kinase
MVGQIISHYKILEKLGGGGMGVVYKAEDTKLKRIVALKFLPPELTRDDEAKQRFIHEAQAASALDHPNICTVYEIGETDGGQMFIAMACYEGETLKEKIAQGPMKLDEAVEIALQIAEGIAEAHQHGIVHRDIKPANVLITKSSIVKIVDFGLAKVSGVSRLTKTGSTLGTIAYMAPEQLQGAEIDARADIFSFGVVLYEMLAGKIPFRGEHEAALMYSIMNEEPEPVENLVPGLADEIIRVVACALEKDPGKRYQSMREVVTALKEVVKEPPKILNKGRASIQKRRYTRRTLIVGGGLLAIFLACLVVFMETRLGRRMTWDSATTRRIKTQGLHVNSPDISPDGNWIVYVARDPRNRDNLYVAHASGGESRRVTNDTTWGRKSNPCFTLDASEIIYGQWDRGQNNIFTVSTLGGQPTKIISDALLPVVSPDGRLIAFLRSISHIHHLMVSNLDGSSEKEIVKDSLAFNYNYSLSWSPDGKKIAHLHNFGSTPNDHYTEIFTCDIATGEEKQITSDKKVKDDICWTPSDEFVYACIEGQSENLMVIPASGGAPFRLTLGNSVDFSPRVSRNGKRIVYSNTSQASNLWTIHLETKEMNQLTFEDAFLEGAKYSPDGKRILYLKYEGGVPPQLFTCNTDGTDPIQVSHVVNPSNVSNHGIFWAGDGRTFAYTISTIDTVSGKPESVSNHILVQDISAGNVQDCGEGTLIDWTQDGKYMLVEKEGKNVENSSVTKNKFVLAPVQSLDKPTRVIDSYNSVFFTRDSKSVIYTDSAYIWSLSIDNGQVTRSRKRPAGISWPQEMPDGKSLFNASLHWREGKWIVYKISKVGSVMQKLCEVEGQISGGDVSPDMKKAIFSKEEDKGNIILIDNFR